MSHSLTDNCGEPISVYTQEQAIDDGTLVAIPQPHLHGFNVPVVVTRPLWETLDTPATGAPDADVDTTVRVLGVLAAARFALASGDGQFAKFEHRFAGESHDLFAVVDGNGVTVMFPSDY